MHRSNTSRPILLAQVNTFQNRQIFIVTYFHITPQTSQLSWHLRHWQCILYRLKQATYSLLIKGPDLRQRLTGTRGVSSALTSGPFRLETSKAAYSSTSTHSSETCHITYKCMCLMHQVHRLRCDTRPEELEFLCVGVQQKARLLICQR